jgi:hypothetical protein
MTAHANARAYYDKKKLAIEKNEKTRAASAAALQSAEAKAKSSLQGRFCGRRGGGGGLLLLLLLLLVVEDCYCTMSLSLLFLDL